MATITCYDGVGCIGGNKIFLEDGDTRLWLDFGLDFSRMGAFYEEYLKPKTCLGLYEPMQMGLLPAIRRLYREDLVSKLADPWTGLEPLDLGDASGVLISHTHLDHLGSLHFVREDIPVYSSAMTLAIAKATEDTGAGTPDEYCYTVRYEPADTGELRAAHFARNPSKARPFVFVDEIASAELEQFWSTTPGSLTAKGRRHEAHAIGTSDKCGGLSIRRFPVDHSVYGASAWAVETGSGWVVYTGDLRCHGASACFTWRFAEEAARLKPRALIIEGTRMKDDETCTEGQVYDRALEEVGKAKGLVVADFGPRNVERLAAFLDVARETGRKLILLPKDAYLLEKMATVAGDQVPSLEDKSILIYCKYEASSFNWRKMLRDRYRHKLVQPMQVAQNQEKAICCFSFFDVNELAYIRPVPGSTWIYSSCEPFSEDMRIDVERLSAWLKEYGVGFPADPRDVKSPFHVSGHACKSDLLKIVEIVRPQTLVPVHTESPELYVEALKGLCEVRLPEKGVPIVL